ncbi:hypothetical protein B0T14DRAFT_517322 [Immersiella caudata]|uniref:Uncharacterized protein n=1 Tax=Immersiella caudata TaxID=314043 RepID=A0AA39WYJ6_9PEZI|nr:hypothetical protein B0T14DRAFT_517322 [Immersiella caudata]
MRRTDAVLNPSPEPFSTSMEIHGPHVMQDFTWSSDSHTGLSVSARAVIPVLGLSGLDAFGLIGGLFSKTVKEYWEVFMVTGIAVARRGGRRVIGSRNGRGWLRVLDVIWVSSLPSFTRWGLEGMLLTACSEVPVLAEAGPEVELGTAEMETVTAKHVGGFVWAVRLAKITKNGLQKTWGMETVTGKSSGVGGISVLNLDRRPRMWARWWPVMV